MTVADVLLIAIGAVVLGSALLVVTTRHLVRAGLWLIVTLTGVAAMYLVMSAELVAWVQILLYLGAIIVLLLFAVMLTRAPIGISEDLNRQRWPGALVGLGCAGALASLLVNAYRWNKVEFPEPGTAERIGEQLFQSWVLPFELVGLLLLAALVGAIVLSQSRDASQSGDE